MIVNLFLLNTLILVIGSEGQSKGKGWRWYFWHFWRVWFY